MANLTDDTARIAQVLWGMHRTTGLFRQLNGYDGRAKGLAAKNAGMSVSQLEAAMAGALPITTAQILGVLSSLHHSPALELNGHAR